MNSFLCNDLLSKDVEQNDTNVLPGSGYEDHFQIILTTVSKSGCDRNDKVRALSKFITHLLAVNV